MSSKRRGLGLSLIEVVVFIVVLAVGFAGILILYNQTTVASVDPVVRKQVLAIATSLMEEIQLRGFTYCDPDDPAVYTANSTGDCDPAKIENIGPETFNPPGTETRYSSTAPFDNVNDYNNFEMPLGNIRDITGTLVDGLEAYRVDKIAISPISANELKVDLPDTEDIPTTNALRIVVTVYGPGGVSVSLQGYRLQYAPKTP